MPANPGHIPPNCEIIDPETGHRKGWHKVQVVLRNGWTSRATGAWPAADGRPPTRWTLENHPFDILEWEIAQ